MRVDLQSGSAPVFGSEQSVVRYQGVSFPLSGRRYDIAPDGERFLLIRASTSSDDPLALVDRYEVVLNLDNEISRLLPND